MAGFYGKLPSHGDFLRRRISDAFLTRWDAWLQRAVHDSRAAFGDAWDEVYQRAPAWRFALPFGKGLVAGVMLSAEDRVGRRFPLTVVVELADPASVLSLAAGNQQWFEAAEALVREALVPDSDGLSRLDSGLALLPDPSPPIDSFDLVAWPPATAGIFPLSNLASASLPAWMAALLDAELERAGGDYGACWTVGAGAGGAAYDTEFWLLHGWPDADLYSRMLGLSPMAVAVAPAPVAVPVSKPTAVIAITPPATSPAPVPAGATAAPFEATQELPLMALARPSAVGISAFFSHPGKVREENQDACLDRAEDGIWAVADGLGGLKHGARASAAVIAALAGLPKGLNLADWAHAAREAMIEVNSQLNCAPAGQETGSTIVALTIRGLEAAVLWVGDSRLYRWRAGQLEQLTRDHSSAAEMAADGGGDFADLLGAASELSRAIGADSSLDVDFLRFEVLAGDRFLLCSDGLYAELPADQLLGKMGGNADAATLLTEIIKPILEGRAHDNLTGVLVLAPDGGVIN